MDLKKLFDYSVNGEVSIQTFDLDSGRLLLEKTIDLATGRIKQITDFERDTQTLFTYNADGTVTIETYRETDPGRFDQLVNRSLIDLGDDGKLGSEDDIFQGVEGFQCFKGGECKAFTEYFDSEGRMIAFEGYEEEAERDAFGRLIGQDGQVVMTEAEAKKKIVKVEHEYKYNEEDGTYTVTTYRFDEDGNREEEPFQIETFALGFDGVKSFDDVVIYARRYSHKKKIFYEEVYDDDGRVILFRNLSTGDELRYEYNDEEGTVTIISSLNNTKLTYKYDEENPNNLRLAKLIEEIRDGQRRTYSEKGDVTSTTDRDGITTFYEDGVMVAIIDKDGNILKRFQRYVDPRTGLTTDLRPEAKNVKSTTINLGDIDSDGMDNYKIVYEDGQISTYEVNYELNASGAIHEWSTDSLGTEFISNFSQDGAQLIVSFNSGRIDTYSQISGRHRITRSLDAYGAATDYKYFENINGADPDKNNPDLDKTISQGGRVETFLRKRWRWQYQN